MVEQEIVAVLPGSVKRSQGAMNPTTLFISYIRLLPEKYHGVDAIIAFIIARKAGNGSTRQYTRGAALIDRSVFVLRD
ncbi:hypothetical protein EI42_04562 [Thermosporothrix hazakensis]|jgi:hypothetical protein|uniref:Uncharacterized protein n=1 Tax=Thermosporothrix hazakensis TaxID=644383 RepID=A0A326U2B4_THEHA|nr:hypothetical protein [Thermosporothrix hazakensis]PZW24680.1 hypothetical protein EI42_04562 [Thermosporothrix hazakensis]